MEGEKLLIPGAIVVAGLLIGGGIYLSGGSLGITNTGGETNENNQGNAMVAGEQEGANPLAPSASNVRPVDETDHVFGNPNAEIAIIEYSDYECPFCARFHPTVEQIVEESDGKIKWVYRHFPLTNIHSRAFRAAVASECVAELAGNEAFWSFSNSALNNIRSLGDDFYVATARELGIPETPFRECLNSDKYDERIEADLQNGINSGGSGTPFNVIVDGKGNAYSFSGALPYPQTKAIVDRALSSS